MPSTLKMSQINKQYPGVKALDHVDFELKAGEIRALLGKNGAGKSTLIKILSGAVQPDSGEIHIEGKKVNIKGPRDAFSLGISTVYQEMSLVPGLTVAENILLGRWPTTKKSCISWIDKNKINELAQKSLDQLGIQLNLNEQVKRLNVAQQQLVEIAKAISFEPRVLVLDEPTSALPSEEVESLHKVVRNLAKQGIAIIYVTHRLQEIPLIADDVTVLRDGKLVGSIDVNEATPEKIANMMIGSNWQRTAFKRTQQSGTVKLSVRNLSRTGLLHNLSFDIHAGEVLGIAGLLGSGRTELIRSIFGLDTIDAGEICVNGTIVSKPNPMIMKSLGIGLTPEDRRRQGLVMPFPVEQNLTLAGLKRISKNGILNLNREHQLAQDMVNELNIKTSNLKVRTQNLSGGNQQKVVVGNWLNNLPEILIMDEPSRGIDVQAKEQIFKLVRELAQKGLAVLFISSEIEEVLDVSDRILVMNQGHFTHEINPKSVDLENLLAMTMEELADVE
ncbi:MAG: sugar ABC transporter ATP-binding protein [Anaerolineaceae bacterium]|nr:sugar ABC transporter ATP-binding protein [Anaerolineaceae bacterium]